jgi:D-inositol-3-phosphate glycosyltransferase
MTPLKRIAIISVHASPIAKVGGKKVGGLNVYVREVAKTFARQGLLVDLFTRQESEHQPTVDHSLGEGVRVVHVPAGTPQPIPPDDLLPHLQQFAAGVIAFTIRHNIQYDFIFSHYWLSGLVANATARDMGNTLCTSISHAWCDESADTVYSSKHAPRADSS